MIRIALSSLFALSWACGAYPGVAAQSQSRLLGTRLHTNPSSTGTRLRHRNLHGDEDHCPNYDASYSIAVGRPATQSSDDGDLVAGLAVDGDFDTFSRTDIPMQGSNTWWKVELASNQVVEEVHIHRRHIANNGWCAEHPDECKVRNRDFSVYLLDSDKNEVARSDLVGTMQGDVAKFQFCGVKAKYVKVYMDRLEHMSFSEVTVMGRTIANLAWYQRASQSSEMVWRHYLAEDRILASNAVDGDLNTYSKTSSNHNPTWYEVALPRGSTVDEIHVYKRPGFDERSADFAIWLVNSAGDAMSSEQIQSGPIVGDYATFVFAGNHEKVDDLSVRIVMTRNEEMNWAEVRVWGSSDWVNDQCPGLYDSRHISLNRPATQSSTAAWAFEQPASNAVDGDFRSSSHTNINETIAGDKTWWQVDVGDNMVVDEVWLFRRSVRNDVNMWCLNNEEECHERYHDFSVILWDEHENTVAQEDFVGRLEHDVEKFKFCGVPAKYVRIYMDRFEEMSWNEVTVLGKDA